MQNNLSEKVRVIIGCIGGGFVGISTYPIPAYKLLIADPSMEVTIFGWICRIIFSAFVGGLWVFLNEEEHNRMKLFQLGIVGPAMISALISANSSSIDKFANTSNLFSITTPAFADDGKIVTKQKDSGNISTYGIAKNSPDIKSKQKGEIISKQEGTIIQKFIGGFTGNTHVIESVNINSGLKNNAGSIKNDSRSSCFYDDIGSIKNTNSCK